MDQEQGFRSSNARSATLGISWPESLTTALENRRSAAGQALGSYQRRAFPGVALPGSADPHTLRGSRKSTGQRARVRSIGTARTSIELRVESGHVHTAGRDQELRRRRRRPSAKSTPSTQTSTPPSTSTVSSNSTYPTRSSGRLGPEHSMSRVQSATGPTWGSTTTPRPRTMRCDWARGSFDRHATYIVATFVAGASR